MKLIFFILLFCINFESIISCDMNQHTDIYWQYFDKFSELYQINTFGDAVPNSNKCTDLGTNFRSKYLNILKTNNIKYSDAKECYEIQHIIDKVNSPYEKCNPNILGNVIMAYSTWNKQISDKCWDIAKNEKMKIYGKYIFCKAIQNILECNHCNVSILPECYNITSNDKTIVTIMKIFVLLTLSGIIAFLIIKYQNNNLYYCINNKYQKTKKH